MPVREAQCQCAKHTSLGDPQKGPRPSVPPRTLSYECAARDLLRGEVREGKAAIPVIALYLVDPARIICLFQSLSHACLRTAILSQICERLRISVVTRHHPSGRCKYLPATDNHGNSVANTCVNRGWGARSGPWACHCQLRRVKPSCVIAGKFPYRPITWPECMTGFRPINLSAGDSPAVVTTGTEDQGSILER